MTLAAHLLESSLFALAAAAGASGFTRVALVASDERTQPQIVFPTACPVLESYEEVGAADLTLTVEPDGSVDNVVVDNSSGNVPMDESFRKALGKSRVVPGTVNGNPQPMTIAVKMEAKYFAANRLSVSVTVTRGSLPRVAAYTCLTNDPHPFDPRRLAK